MATEIAELVELAEAGDAQALAAQLWTMPIEELEQLAADTEVPDGL